MIMDKEKDIEEDPKILEITTMKYKDNSDDSNSYEESLTHPRSLSWMSYILAAVCCPLTLAGCYEVQENQEVVILNYGKFIEVVSDPGIHCGNCWGRDIIPISKAKISTELPVTKVIDKLGNPVMVSGVVFYYFKNTRKAALDVLDPQAFVKDQATAVLKQIVSQYPYEHQFTRQGDDDETVEELPCLKSDAAVISAALVKELQQNVRLAGAVIDTFRFNEISYAPEVSASLLKRQQAEAIITARTTLVEGAVQIAAGAIRRLERKGVGMDTVDKTRLVSNLLTVICAEQQVQPALMLGST